MEENKILESADQNSLLGAKTNPVPKPEVKIGIDTDNIFFDNIVAAGQEGKIDISKIESFSQISQTRDTMYALLDTMAEDTTISAVLETYAEDATERNDKGDIVWVDSNDSNISKYITYLLNTMNVNKNVYKWVYSLCKYGDIYLRLYRESEFEDVLFDKETETQARKHLTEAINKQEEEQEKEALNEQVTVKAFDHNDRYVHYLEMISNPAEMFELTKFGKTYAYIQAPVTSSQSRDTNALLNSTFRYSFKKKDVNVFDATAFVHGALEDNTSRVPEEVELFLPKDGTNYDDQTDVSLKYTVKRGQSLLYNSYRLWRELTLLENAMLLNRITKSSILRIIGVEVGDMPKEQVGPHLMSIKNLIEQKAAVNVGNAMNEYTNPGPMENNIYVPTHNQIGSITMQSVGGDVSVTGLDDIDYFKNKFFGGLRVPKQYFGFTDDNAGFSGGESLSLISSRYAKMIKRIQNTIIQTLTDAINLMLLDKGLDIYVNKFELQMLSPTTAEEKERRENMSNRINFINDTMNLLEGVEDPSARLKILNCLLNGVINDPEVTSIIQDEIDKLDELSEAGVQPSEEGIEGSDDEMFDHSGMHSAGEFNPDDNVTLDDTTLSLEEPEGGNNETILPTPNDLGQDFTDNENPDFQ